jgi:hypothetical protein
MNVYIINHSTYGYIDGEFYTTTEVFESLESAQAYFELIKTNIIDEYLDYAEVSSLRDMDNDIFYMDDEPTINNMDYLYIDYDDYGWDKLRIEEKPVMAFKEA